MNLNDIKALMQEFDASGIHKFELELDTFKIKMAKESKEPRVMPVAAHHPIHMAPAHPMPMHTPEAAAPEPS